MATITINLPEGYENPSHLVVVVPGETKNDYPVYATVLQIKDGKVVDEREVGGGGRVAVLTDAGRTITEMDSPAGGLLRLEKNKES